MYIVFKLSEVNVHEDMIAQEGDVNAVAVYPEKVAEFECESDAMEYAEKKHYSVFDCDKRDFVAVGSIEVEHWDK